MLEVSGGGTHPRATMQKHEGKEGRTCGTGGRGVASVASKGLAGGDFWMCGND